jgi:hypothetical protein
MNRQSRLKIIHVAPAPDRPKRQPYKFFVGTYVNKGKVYPYASRKRNGT